MRKRKLFNFLDSFEKRKLRNRKKLNYSKCLRISIFKSNRHFYVQLINDEKGATLVSASTLDPAIRSVCNGRINSEAIKHVSHLMIERLSNIKLEQRLVLDCGAYKYSGLISQFTENLRKSGFIF
ncbi:MAG: 50S ribosomal protein L18 [Wolbachia endosymbiont of Menacanthus eurysternus]|nr:MAG: 50S ribosomal protein L18 [Wolbachia endosymbiont of Menacanthus eurysternus]